MAENDDRLLERLSDALRRDAAPTDDQVAGFRRRVESRFHERGRTAESRPRGRRWIDWATAVAAVALVLAAFSILRSEGTVEFSGEMTSPSNGVTAEVEVVAVGIGRVITFTTDQLPILPTGEYYEFWFVSEDDSAGSPNRISAGTFHPDPDGRSVVEFVAAVDPTVYPLMEITAEPGDGNPQATGPVVLRAVIGPR